MTPHQRIHLLTDALRQIANIAVEPGGDPMVALLDAQRIADEARANRMTKYAAAGGEEIPFTRIGLRPR